jgi:hypothetical protein
VEIDARVCHARPHVHQGEPGQLIGLEFLTTSPTEVSSQSQKIF